MFQAINEVSNKNKLKIQNYSDKNLFGFSCEIDQETWDICLKGKKNRVFHRNITFYERNYMSYERNYICYEC